MSTTPRFFRPRKKTSSERTLSPAYSGMPLAENRNDRIPFRRMLVGFALLLAALLSTSPLAAGEMNAAFAVAMESIRQDDLTEEIALLADDKMQGREAGTPCGRKAGDILAEKFRELGLKPLGPQGSYFQHFGEGFRNVLGWLPGSDPELRDEFILVGAHYDHIGVRTKEIDGKKVEQICNGADDNASGTSSVLELAEAMTIMPVRPKRSILFALWDAEEKGLIGSRHFAKYPRIAMNRIVGGINLDMIGSLRDETLFVIGSRSGLGFRERICRLNEETNLRLEFPKRMWYNSDHAPFYRQGVPVVFFFTGFTDTYHRPEDDLERLNLSGLVKVNRLALRLLWEMADRPERVAYRKSEKDVDALESLFREHREPPDRLGIIIRGAPQDVEEVLEEVEVDGEMVEKSTAAAFRSLVKTMLPPLENSGLFSEASEKSETETATSKERRPGVLEILEITPDSPAAAVGVSEKDRIVAVEGRKLRSPAHFHALLSRSSGPVELVLEDENGGQRTVKPTPTGEPQRLGFTFWFDPAEPNAAIVGYVFEDRAADHAGLKSGDRLYEVDHRSVTRESMESLQQHPPDQITLWVERRGRLMEIALDLSRPEAPSPKD
jgi:hypothetical protein